MKIRKDGKQWLPWEEIQSRHRAGDHEYCLDACRQKQRVAPVNQAAEIAQLKERVAALEEAFEGLINAAIKQAEGANNA
ncbi:hypothetical protein IU438_18045 [Nocardia cyriacigeorgica]|uniref:hypothetical protein n=1 Tax=Nocardia cyriacigeorgica TaxID=135487 RepID=UPI0018934CD3|nr:hypothetical protein [Nocardia cyriacigeorgica]MBF6397693.1 hypothetical protein [Nocardia cyriacigeorgica]MBF6402649.1 hypothetical protein [Nocardia cyriacigeorgica]